MSYRTELRILRVKKLLASVASPRNRRALRYGVAPSIEHASALARKDYKTVVDIGANRGQFALFARGEYPSARITSFEPLAAPASVYTAIFESDALTHLYNAGVGSADLSLDINVTREDDSSSILLPSETGKTAFGITVAGKERVRIAPLTRFMSATEIAAPALLKLDVQGYELDALMGCGDLLAAFDDVYVEVSFVEIYEAQALAKDVIEWLHRHGFSLCGAFNQVTDADERPLQADLLFERQKR